MEVTFEKRLLLECLGLIVNEIHLKKSFTLVLGQRAETEAPILKFYHLLSPNKFFTEDQMHYTEPLA